MKLVLKLIVFFIGLTQLYNEPAGTSLYTLQHFLQLALRGKFARIDLGPVKNMRRYGQVNPPEYNLKNVQVPTKLYVGDSDILTKPKNVEKVRKILPHILKISWVNHPTGSKPEVVSKII